MKNKSMWLFAPAFALLGGCSILTPPAQMKAIEGSGTYWINYDSDRRGAIVKISADDSNGGILKVCAEPAPDTSKDAEIESRVTQKEIVDASAKVGLHTVVLPGRNSTVLALRESLYRLCELSINRPNISDLDIISAYGSVIESLIKKSDAELKQAEIFSMQLSDTSQPGLISRSYARDEELLGFEKIIKEDFPGALEKFKLVEEIYPGYHNAYEIGMALKKYLSDKEVSEEEKKKLFQDILSKWSWKVPEEILSQIRKKTK